MPTLDDVAALALALPEAVEDTSRGRRAWSVNKKAFAWERPFSKADIKRYGDVAPPEGPILAVKVEDLGEKEAVLEANPEAFFTIPHFDGYSMVLVQLDLVDEKALKEALLDSWLTCAPDRLTAAYVKD